MANAKELYVALRDDPELDIPEGESRESAAWKETSQRMRQHNSNAKALGMAAEVSEPSSIEKFILFTDNQDFSRSNILESLDVILMKATGSDDATRAYRRAAMKIHPDTETDPERKKFHEEQMKELNRINAGNGTSGGGRSYHLKNATIKIQKKDHARHLTGTDIFNKSKLEGIRSRLSDLASDAEKGSTKDWLNKQLIPLYDRIMDIHNRPDGFSKVSDSDLTDIRDAVIFNGGSPNSLNQSYKFHDMIAKKSSTKNSQSRMDKLLGKQTYNLDINKYTEGHKNYADLVNKQKREKIENDPDFAEPTGGKAEQIRDFADKFDAAKAAAFPDWSPNEPSRPTTAARKARAKADEQRAKEAKKEKEVQSNIAEKAKTKPKQEKAEKAAKAAAEKEEEATMLQSGAESANKETEAAAKKYSEGAKSARIGAIPVGPFKSKNAFLDTLKDVTGTREKGSTKLTSWFNGLSSTKQKQLANNIDAYFSQADQSTDAPDAHIDLRTYSSSLEGDERDNFLNHLANNKNPFTVDAEVGASELRSKGYVDKGQRASSGKYRLTPDGASHLLGESKIKQSSKNPFNISANKFNEHSVDLTDENSNWKPAERVERKETLKDKQNKLAADMTEDGIFADRNAADRTIQETTDDDTDFNAHYDKIEQYHDDMGGHPIKSSGAGGHIKNINAGTTDTVRQHVPPTAEDTTTEETPEEKEKFSANIHGVNLTEDDVELQSNGKYKLTEDARDLFGYTETVGESSFNRDPANNPRQAQYLEDLEFDAGQTISGNVGKEVPWTAPKDTPKADAPKTEAPKTPKPKAKTTKKPETESKKPEAKPDAPKETPVASEDTPPSSEVSNEEHENVKKIIGELAGRHRNRGDSYAKQNLDSFGSEYIDRLNNNKLTREDVDKLKDHLNDFDEDADHLRDKGIDISNYEVDQPPSPPTDPTPTDDKGVDAADKKVDADAESESRSKAFDDLMATEHGQQVLDHTYDVEHGEDNPFVSPEQHKENLRAAYIKDPSKAQGVYSKAWKASNKAKEKEGKDERKDQANELKDRASNAGHRLNRTQVNDLLDEHNGDVDAALEATDKEAAAKLRRKQDANKLPYTEDELSTKIFGDIDPNSRLTHLSQDRKDNKYGQVSTTLARELIAHYRKYEGDMGNKEKKTVEGQLAFLKDPSTRFPNMRKPKGEMIGADIKAAMSMVKEAEAKGIDLQGPEANRIYSQRESQRNKKIMHHQTTHINPESDDKKAEAHGENGSFSKTDNTTFLHYDEEGNVIGRKRRKDGEWHIEDLKDDGSDDHHKTGDHTAKGSRVKEHVSATHGNSLSDKEKETLDKLRQAHSDGDEAAISEHTQSLEDGGLHQSDFLHDEDDRPSAGPPDPQKAAEMRAQGLEWNESISRWVNPDTYDKHQSDNKSSLGGMSTIGTGEQMGIFHPDGTADQGHYMQSHAGLHALNHDSSSIPNSHAGVQAQQLGGLGHIQSAMANASTKGKPQRVSNLQHRHLLQHAPSESPKQKETTSATGKQGSGSFADRIKNLFKEYDETTPIESLQLHVALQKLEEKEKTGV